MIRIRKPAQPPAVLLEEGRAATQALCRQVEHGQTLTIERKVYGHPSVKESLLQAQYDKCCFCESKVSHVAFGDVEHFRPKAACQPSVGARKYEPGYYWLAYEWSNLYFACEQCNRRHKGNLFPLEDEAARVRSHHEAGRLAMERPIYIDPGCEDPQEHIEFRREYATTRNGSPRGRTTVTDLDLNRMPLCSRRRDHRALLLTFLQIIRNWLSMLCPAEQRSVATTSAQRVLGSMRDDAAYAAMARALMREVMPWREVSPSTAPDDLLEQLEDDAVAGRWLVIPPR